MRVRFANFVEFCVRISQNDDSNILIITTHKGSVYTVKCNDAQMAKRLAYQALELGYIDVSNLEYNN